MQIFGDTEFSVKVIRCWVEENIADRVKVVIGEKRGLTIVFSGISIKIEKGTTDRRLVYNSLSKIIA